MKKLFVCLFVMMLSLTGCSSSSENRLETILESGVITVVTSPDFPPYEFIDPTKTGNEQYVGADLELARYIASELGVELEVEAVDFNTVLGNISMGLNDMAIASMAPTDERLESMSFSISYDPNLDESQDHGLIILEEELGDYTSLESFSDLVIGVQSASLQEQFTIEQIPNAVTEVISNLNDGVLMLLTGKIDALACSTETALQLVLNNDGIAMSGVYFDSSSVSQGASVAVPLGEDELVAAIDEIVEKVLAEGLYDQWVEESQALATSLGLSE
ncbi:MAG: transporter substrate-binding domain-containing protein [Erysipelotrichaceae bacterium]